MSTPPFASDVAACRAAQHPWAALRVRDRLRPVRELRRLLVDHADEVTAAVAADVGRPAVEVVGTELLPTAAALKFLEQRAAALLKPRAVPGGLRPTWLLGCRDVVHRRPWGVVAVIGTWNYPVYLNLVQIAQAFTAGNAVLWKPSENTPRTAELTARLVRDAGFPADLLRTLPATREAGPLVAEADVDHVVFTGSDAVGRKLAARLGERLVPSTLELSGCDAMFVLADADVRAAAHAAWFGVTLNRGQTCIAVRRVFVHRSRVAEFEAALLPLAEKAGPAPLVTPGQQAQAERLIDDAVKRGAHQLGAQEAHPPAPFPARDEGDSGRLPTASAGTGSATGDVAHPPPSLAGKGAGGLGASLRPTLLLNCPPDAAICREAAFAPVAAVIPFDTVDDALAMAARSPFGLSASVFSADARAAAGLAARIPAGSVVVNDVLAPTAHPATPFGGRGASGWGVTQGAEGLLAMTTPQAVAVRRGRFRPHVDEAVAPDPEATADILRGLLRATHGRGLRDWLGGVRQLIRGVRRKRR